MKEKEKKSEALKGDFDSVRDFPEETLCPSCGKFVGAYEKCPYCGATLKKRMALAIFKRGCLIMSIVGLIALWYAAVKMEPALITIGEIGPTYNKGIFRVKGTVTKVALNPESYFSFRLWVNDGTGKIKLQSSDLEKLEKLEKIPTVGDEIEAIGEVSLSAQYGLSMNLKAADRMEIIKKEVLPAKIGEIDEKDVGNIYALYGEVVRIRDLPIGIAVVLGDETGTIELTLFKSEVEQLSDADAIKKPGTEIDLIALVSMYRDQLQLNPRSPEDVRVSSEDRIATAKIPKEELKKKKELPTTKIGVLSPKQEGDTFSVRGKITNVREFSKGTSLTLKDNTGTVGITLWNSNFANYPDKASVFKVGNELTVRGKLGLYRGDIQLTPNSHDDVQLAGKKKAAPPKKEEPAKPAAPKPAPPKKEKKAEAQKPAPPVAEPTTPAAPKAKEEKKAAPAKPVETKGEAAPEKKVEAPKPAAPKPTAAPAEEKPAQPKAAPEAPPAEPKAEATPAAGEKAEAPKPAPAKPEPPKAAEPKATPAAVKKKSSITFTPMNIGDITEEKIGQFAKINGEVVGSSEFSRGLKLQVKDDSGTIEVVIWSDLLDKLTNKDKLTEEGAKLSIKGKIGSYRGQMQLSPKYPNQIKIAE